MELFLRITAVLLIAIGTWYFTSEIRDYGRAIFILALWGAICLLLGKYATKIGFFSRLHYISAETPGCIWIGFGILCWLAAIMFYLAAK
jgi:hypothetical protein